MTEAEAKAAYDAVGRLRAALADLAAVDRAKAEYEAFRADLAAKLAALSRRPVAAVPASSPTAPTVPAGEADGPSDPPPSPPPPPTSAVPPSAPKPPAADADARRQLKKAVGRWQAVWGWRPTPSGG